MLSLLDVTSAQTGATWHATLHTSTSFCPALCSVNTKRSLAVMKRSTVDYVFILFNTMLGLIEHNVSHREAVNKFL